MLTLLAMAHLLTAQVDVESHLGLVEGRSWRYVASDSGTSTSVELAAASSNPARYAVESSDGTRRIASFDPDAGLLLHSVTLADTTAIEYERPVVLLPPSLEPGDVHSSQRRFVRWRGEEKVGVGAHHFEAELLGTASVETPAGVFDDCLQVRRHAVRMDFTGGQEGFDVREWYAPGVGLVKASGSRFVRDASGETVATEPIDFALESVHPEEE